MYNYPYSSYPNDPNDPHSQDTVAGQYPQSPFNQQLPFQQPGQLVKPTFKQRFGGMSRWKRFGTIGCSTLIATLLLCSLCALVGNALPKAPAAAQPSPVPTHQVAHQTKPAATPKPSPTPVPSPSPTSTPSPMPTPTPTAEPTQPPVQ